MRFAPCQLRPRSTYVGTSGDGQGLDVGTGEAVDITSQVGRGDISDGVVVWGNTDVIVLALIDLNKALSDWFRKVQRGWYLRHCPRYIAS